MRNGTSQSPFRLALDDNPGAPVRPAPGHGAVRTGPQGGGRTSPWPSVEWVDGVSDALASGLCGGGPSPLRHAGQTPAPTPTGDYRPSLRSPWPAASAEYLKTEEDMADYLEARFQEAGNDAAFIAKALGHIARARGMSQLARDTGLERCGTPSAASSA